ncbi:MAG: PqqD family protein [Polyangiaceae bacterium]
MNLADSRLVARADVHVRAFDGELVILDLARGDYFGVNEVGARLWAGLASGQTTREVALDLRGVYDVEEGKLLEDLLALTNELLARGLVRVKT